MVAKTTVVTAKIVVNIFHDFPIGFLPSPSDSEKNDWRSKSISSMRCSFEGIIAFPGCLVGLLFTCLVNKLKYHVFCKVDEEFLGGSSFV